MLNSDITAISKSAANKAEVCSQHMGKYMMRSIVAGFYIVVATILSNVSAAVLYPTYPELAKLLGGFLFSIAIILIVFIGGELFTGNNLTMAIGVYNRSCSIKDLGKVWFLSYLGNFIGAFFLSAIFVASGASRGVLTEYYESFIFAKLELTPIELLLRGVLCNFLVCLAVWIGVRMKTESGKIMVMSLVIMAFVTTGFEHCIANMAIFSISGMMVDGLDIMLILKNMLFVTIGNILGGSVLLGLPLKLMSGEK
ncbi:MAG: formate/nitrite transporter family protein [Clostridiales bacterium]|nr:formate/nitrite transporter family protein [Clostridiales bacterium]